MTGELVGKGEIVEVTSNIAHTLIDSSKAKIYTEKESKKLNDKMMSPRGKKRGYITK